ncbi:MAG TPA: prephenate dehydrogenase [Limnochordales bacterium]
MAVMAVRCAVVGLGLIGTSVGLGLRVTRRGGPYHVVGYDVDGERLRQAHQLGAVDEAAPDLAGALARADLVVVAVPARQVVPVLLQASSLAPAGAVFTDVASIKQAVVQAVGSRLPGGQWFVGGHPMAGSERAGPSGADPYLFENAIYVLTPLPEVPSWALERVEAMVRALGAVAVRMDPDLHDRAAAAASHLPHVAAVCLVHAAEELARQGVPVWQLAAGGFRDASRLALGHESVWEPILALNRQALAQAMAAFRRSLEQLEALLAQEDGSGLANWLRSARERRASVPFRAKGYGSPLHELVVRVQDRPGAIHEVTGVLARAGINLADIEILRAREGEAGTLRLAFDSPAQQERALVLLQQAGWKAWPR